MNNKKVKKIIDKLTIYLHRIGNGAECDTFRGLIHELELDYFESLELGLLEFNNEVSHIEERLKEKK